MQSNNSTYLVNSHMNRCIEKGIGRRIVPVPFALLIELRFGQMARHAGHDNVATTPWRAKVKGKRVVLDVLVAC
jgi:hypothetical protein